MLHIEMLIHEKASWNISVLTFKWHNVEFYRYRKAKVCQCALHEFSSKPTVTVTALAIASMKVNAK